MPLCVAVDIAMTEGAVPSGGLDMDDNGRLRFAEGLQVLREQDGGLERHAALGGPDGLPCNPE